MYVFLLQHLQRDFSGSVRLTNIRRRLNTFIRVNINGLSTRVIWSFVSSTFCVLYCVIKYKFQLFHCGIQLIINTANNYRISVWLSALYIYSTNQLTAYILLKCICMVIYVTSFVSYGLTEARAQLIYDLLLIGTLMLIKKRDESTLIDKQGAGRVSSNAFYLPPCMPMIFDSTFVHMVLHFRLRSGVRITI